MKRAVLQLHLQQRAGANDGVVLALCDFSDLCSCRGDKPMPAAPGHQPDLPLYIHVSREKVVLYRDMSGTSLHNRGYRSAMHRASLNAAAAAGVLILAGWPQLAASGGTPRCAMLTVMAQSACP